jgi:hypothetical protein
MNGFPRGGRRAALIAAWAAAVVAAGAGCTCKDPPLPPPHAGTDPAFPGTANLPPAMNALTIRPDATAAPVFAPGPASRPVDCVNVTPGVRHETTCCTPALRALVTPAEVRAACPESGAYAYEELIEGRSCMYFFARGDAIVSVVPAEEIAAQRVKLHGAPGFAEEPALAELLRGAGAAAPVEAFRMRRGPDGAPTELRTFVRAGERGLVLAVRPRSCHGPGAQRLLDAVALRFASGIGGPPITAPGATDLPGLLPGARAEWTLPGASAAPDTGAIGLPSTPPTVPHGTAVPSVGSGP